MNCRENSVALFLYALLILALSFFACFTSAASLLPAEEVEALNTISEKLRNNYWNVTPTSCNDGVGLNHTFSDDDIDGSGNDTFSHVLCNCTFNGSTICHVTGILLKGLNLPGVLPPAEDFAKLKFLQVLDLTRNYISGSISRSFGQLRLTKLSLLGNRINGTIPKEIGDISTLEELVLEDNELEGPLHENLGKLSRLKKLQLSANNITGVIPETFGNLKNLTDFRIDGNPISGKVPSFIGNWTKLTKLYMHGTLLEGPIPQNISLLENIDTLQISGLRGGSMEFPDLEGMKNMETLVLRNCSIAGTIPEYINKMTDLETLDLSFNNLSGNITIRDRQRIQYLFLGHNMLSGKIPQWILDARRYYIDLSYNNLTESEPKGCSTSYLNLVSSYSVPKNDSKAWCSKKDLPCSSGKARYHSLFINCGGDRTEFEDNEYEGDSTGEGPSYFFASSDNRWAYTSSGLFLTKEDVNFVATNKFPSNVINEDIYKTARLAPNSLIYYGFCMRQGSYKVRLHFAEIMFSNDSTYSSLGRRLFDVRIQGNLVLADYNIMEKANGSGKGITEVFDDVLVNGSTLEIHLYWTGKGTNAIPQRSVHGPLISAITVTPNFNPDKGLSAGAIVGIVISCCVFILLILVALRMTGYLGGKVAEDNELRALDLQTGYFTLRQVKAATNNFDQANKIGEGGFGPVYKGVLSDGGIIAVKQLSSKSKQGNREFINEIGMISALQHPNLVKLHGCCIEGNQLLLIYEYMENNCLSRALFGRVEQRLSLDWQTRKKICLGIAKGLAYLHEESRLKIVHRDIKASNVLLDKDLSAKISDFGLARLDEEENTHISTRIAGTVGYMAPEYAMRGYLTDKADVYSFGIVALEIVSGKSNTNYRPKDEFVYLLDWFGK
ncbi:probable LRR receptor-like serine/threonine-protein kinase At1g53430 isoform X2 [Ipomoea triloba]|uniref:probable LRR receptor-like serine/threonine-protein kinase At1g53430 isoform X2 n=1 Tax=Ipomoea triloba TaxID=35885 RepID=UPI00125D9D8F|nr:probable LRR receptor-like serine/threonine-protein kinase At1g53430 isoform X2 [Ipomoea triloba]